METIANDIREGQKREVTLELYGENKRTKKQKYNKKGRKYDTQR